MFLFQVMCVNTAQPDWMWPGLAQQEMTYAGSGLNGRYIDMHGLTSVVQWIMVS